MTIPKSLEFLEQQRASIANQVAALGDLRCGSITSTTGRCGKPNCHCHQPKDPGHGPNLRLTYKVNGKTVTESLPDPAAIRKAEREIDEFRKLQLLHKELVEVNAQICQMRPSEPDGLSPQKKNGGRDPPRGQARSRPTVARHLQRPPQDGVFGSGSYRNGGALGDAPRRGNRAERTAAFSGAGRKTSGPFLALAVTRLRIGSSVPSRF